MKLNLRTGRIEHDPPSPTPYDLARRMAMNLNIRFDSLDRPSQQRWIDAAQRTIRDLRL